VYEYLGSSTWGRSDPLGLFVGYDDLIIAGVGGMRGGLDEMIGQYTDNMLADVEWARDWDMGDDWHTRLDNRWVNLSFALGFYHGMMDQVLITLLVEPLDEFMARATGGAKRGAKAGIRTIRTMRGLNRLKVYHSVHEARKFRKAGEQSHHLVELQIGRDQRWRNRLKGSGPAVNVEERFHLSNTRIKFNRAYRELGVNPKQLTRKQAETVIRRVYASAPRIRNEALKWLRGR